MFTVLHPLGLILSFLWGWLHKRRNEGRIRLQGPEGQGREGEDVERENNGPREVDVDGVWG